MRSLSLWAEEWVECVCVCVRIKSKHNFQTNVPKRNLPIKPSHAAIFKAHLVCLSLFWVLRAIYVISWFCFPWQQEREYTQTPPTPHFSNPPSHIMTCLHFPQKKPNRCCSWWKIPRHKVISKSPFKTTSVWVVTFVLQPLKKTPLRKKTIKPLFVHYANTPGPKHP